ncbi:MAG: eL32 family ribosomal protein [archaeon]
MITKRNKPAFNRQHWDRYLRLGKKVKKHRHWRHTVGGDSKMRLKVRGKPARPTIGWGAEKANKGKVNGFVPVRVETLAQLALVKKAQVIVIASIGKKKRMQIIAEANKNGIKILNKYRENKNATK